MIAGQSRLRSPDSISVSDLQVRLQCRQDLVDEPVCEQAVQQPVQSHNRRRLVSQTPRYLCLVQLGGLLTASFRSLTKEIMVDDKLVTMQVRCLTTGCST